MTGWAWAKTRTAILIRDGYRCRTCGAPATTVDHVTPVARGGSDDPANLAAICAPCHHAKTAAEAAQGRKLRAPGRVYTR